MLESIKKGRMVFEKAMRPEKISKIKRLKDSGDIKGILKELNPIIDEIKDKCSRLNFDDITYKEDDNILDIGYNSEIDMLLLSLKYKTRTVDEEMHQRIFGGGWSDTILEIELDKDMLNRIDIVNGLPLFMKGIGLGKKIYKKIIKDFGYISSFNGYEPSIDSSMVWESLANDNELYSFSNDENLICFWNELEYEIIIEKLKEFYENKSDFQFDDDFLIKYDLREKDLNKILIHSTKGL